MTHHGFVLQEETEVTELSSIARLWKHEKTGACLLSLINTDENKVFGVSFRTPPEDSTGVAHILEHSVLCGSKKYPVKEPFVELLKGSLQTFLNAFTYPDKTCYPVASANLTDFRNLTDVYLDAVFFPVISKNIFEQEGWHLEAQDSDEPFSYKGVVYNEMKGAFSSPESVMGRYCLHALFPDTVYGLESGGDPEVIPELTYTAFKNFHKTYYHPSNARFFFWGDDSEDERLEQLNRVLNEFSSFKVSSSIGLQKVFSAAKKLTVPFASGGEDKGMVVVNWLGPDVMDMEAGLAFKMLDHILLGMPASPLRRALIESGLGEDLAGQGLESELRQLTFAAGLKGSSPKDAAAVEELILSTLRTLVEKGIEHNSIEAAVNSVEFSLRENNTGRFPVGLSVMLNALTTWLHDGNPLDPLRFEAPLATIKAKLEANEPLFENLIKQWLLDNTHRVTVVLTPDTELAERQEKSEKNRLAAVAKAMSKSQREEVARHTKELAAWQAQPDSAEALATIPRLGVTDLPLKNALIPSLALENNGYFHGLPTGGIVYVEIAFDLASISEKIVPLLPLFGRALLEMGTTKRDFVELNMAIAGKTGGMDVESIFLGRLGSHLPAAKLIFEGKTTPNKLSDLFDLFKEIIIDCDLDDQDRFLRMVLEEKARQEHGLIPSGHMVAALRLRSLFSPAGALSELSDGVSQLFYLRELAERVTTKWDEVLGELTYLRKRLFTQSGVEFNITALAQQESLIKPLQDNLIAALPKGEPFENAVWKNRMDIPAEALILPAQVNYIGKGVDLFQADYAWHGSAMVILKYLRTGYLWERIRVQGGAYGCVCGLDRATGAFYVVSYRDPNILPTLEVYDNIAIFLQKGGITQAELNASIVGAIGEIDTYLLPDAKGRTWYLRHITGDTKAARQLLRDEVLSTTPQHCKQFGQALEALAKTGRIASLGGAALQRVAMDKGWSITDVMQ